MTDQCSAHLLPVLRQNPPHSPIKSHPAKAEEWSYWQEKQNTLQLELEAVESDQFLSPLSLQEREQIRRVYLDAMARCRQKMNDCLSL